MVLLKAGRQHSARLGVRRRKHSPVDDSLSRQATKVGDAPRPTPDRICQPIDTADELLLRDSLQYRAPK